MKKVIAHRGLSSRFPENTLISFKEALKTKAFAVECDVHLSKDQIPMVIHDEELSRTTPGVGKVGSYTYDELKAFKVPSLKEVLELVVNGSQKYLLIEIKTHQEDMDYRKQVGPIVYETVMKVIPKKRNRVILISFDEFILKTIRQLDKKIKLAPIFFQLPKDGSMAEHAKTLQSNMVIFSKKLLTKKKVFHMATQVKHFVYTALPSEFQKLSKIKSLTGFATDYADRV